LPILQKIPNN